MELFEPDQPNFSKMAVCSILHIFMFIVNISILLYAVKLFRAQAKASAICERYTLLFPN